MALFADTEPPHLPFTIPDTIDHTFAWNPDLKVFFISLPEGGLVFSEAYFDRKISDRCVAYFQENDRFDGAITDWRALSNVALAKTEFTHIRWQQDWIKLYGKKMPLPRLTAWYGDAGKTYTYSGITSHPQPWNDGLLYLKKAVERVAQTRFNSVLLNWYRDGDDHMGWHADDEPELGQNPTIASVNFGASRDFVLRRKDAPAQKIKIPLKHGSLLIMQGALQHFWQHAVPKRKRVRQSRFNLTFRQIV